MFKDVYRHLIIFWQLYLEDDFVNSGQLGVKAIDLRQNSNIFLIPIKFHMLFYVIRLVLKNRILM